MQRWPSVWQLCALSIVMYRVIVVAVVLAVGLVRGELPLERDDMHVLRSINEAYADASQWENLFALMRDSARHDIDQSLVDEWSHLLADDVRYASQGHGECTRLEQVVRCLASEQGVRDKQRREARSVQYEVAQVRQGGTEVVRVLEVHRTNGNDLRRLLDVYFLHTRTSDGLIWLVEKLPTVSAPIRLGINKFEEP